MNFKMKLISLRTFLVFLCLTLVIIVYFLSVSDDLPVSASWLLTRGETAEPDSVTVRFSGTSTLLFSDGENKWMIDGWFSRPSLYQLMAGTIKPDLRLIEYGLKSNEIGGLDAVIPVHSHFDHAMDSPEVARRTGAILYGSESTLNIGRGWGLEEQYLSLIVSEQPISIGAFEIIPIEIPHFQFPSQKMNNSETNNGEILEPLSTPARISDYKMGTNYAFHVKHPKGSVTIVGSAGFRKGALQGIKTDVLFLGIGGLGGQSEAYRRTYWNETVLSTQPKRIFPIHYDSLLSSIDKPLKGQPIFASFITGKAKETRRFLNEAMDSYHEGQIRTLPRFEEVLLFK